MLGRLNDLRHEGQALFRSYPPFVTRNLARLTPGEIPVFVFHTIEPDRFEDQLRLLKASNFRAISAEDYLDIVEGRVAAQGDEVLLTIDDARSSMWRYGFPILKRHETRVVLFVRTGGGRVISMATTSDVAPAPRLSVATARIRAITS